MSNEQAYILEECYVSKDNMYFEPHWVERVYPGRQTMIGADEMDDLLKHEGDWRILTDPIPLRPYERLEIDEDVVVKVSGYDYTFSGTIVSELMSGSFGGATYEAYQVKLKGDGTRLVDFYEMHRPGISRRVYKVPAI